MQSKLALAEEISQGAETDPPPMSGYQQHLTSPSRQEIFTSVYQKIVMLKEQMKELADNAENFGSSGSGWQGCKPQVLMLQPSKAQVLTLQPSEAQLLCQNGWTAVVGVDFLTAVVCVNFFGSCC